MYMQMHIVYTMYTTLMQWAGGGMKTWFVVLFPRFQHLSSLKGVQVITCLLFVAMLKHIIFNKKGLVIIFRSC